MKKMYDSTIGKKINICESKQRSVEVKFKINEKQNVFIFLFFIFLLFFLGAHKKLILNDHI